MSGEELRRVMFLVGVETMDEFVVRKKREAAGDSGLMFAQPSVPNRLTWTRDEEPYTTAAEEDEMPPRTLLAQSLC
jgi:hypothetical protein